MNKTEKQPKKRDRAVLWVTRQAHAQLKAVAALESISLEAAFDKHVAPVVAKVFKGKTQAGQQ